MESFHNFRIISQLFAQQWNHFTTYDRHKFDKTFCELNDIPEEITVDEINSKSQNLVDLNEDYEEESEEDSDDAGGKSLVGITNSHDNDDVNCCIQLLNQIPNASEVISNSPKKELLENVLNDIEISKKIFDISPYIDDMTCEIDKENAVDEIIEYMFANSMHVGFDIKSTGKLRGSDNSEVYVQHQWRLECQNGDINDGLGKIVDGIVQSVDTETYEQVHTDFENWKDILIVSNDDRESAFTFPEGYKIEEFLYHLKASIDLVDDDTLPQRYVTHIYENDKDIELRDDKIAFFNSEDLEKRCSIYALFIKVNENHSDDVHFDHDTTTGEEESEEEEEEKEKDDRASLFSTKPRLCDEFATNDLVKSVTGEYIFLDETFRVCNILLTVSEVNYLISLYSKPAKIRKAKQEAEMRLSLPKKTRGRKKSFRGG